MLPNKHVKVEAPQWPFKSIKINCYNMIGSSLVLTQRNKKMNSCTVVKISKREVDYS